MSDCAIVRERLDDYLDGLLDEAAFQEIELHLSQCEACRAEERALRAVVARAAHLARELEPRRDLWPGIAERIRGPNVRAFPARPRVSVRWLMPALATAAVGLLALSTMWARRGEIEAPGARPALGSQAAIQAAEADYARAAADLMTALDARRGSLPPETVQAVDTNLKAVDHALGEIRVALGADPQNTQLARLLSATHRRKVAILQQIVRLSTRL